MSTVFVFAVNVCSLTLGSKLKLEKISRKNIYILILGLTI